MSENKKIFISKLSIPGKTNDELSYVFNDTLISANGETPALFGLFYLKGSSEVYHTIIKETVKHYLDFFHRTPKSVSQSLKGEQFDSIEFIFENAIQYTNEQVTQSLLLAQEANPRAGSFDIKKVHFILGALFGDTLFLSVTGSSIHPIYIYPVFRKEGFSHYGLVNIAENSKEAESQRLFSHVVSGKLSIQGSTLILCNQPFVDYLSISQIKHAATNMSTQSLAPYFQGLLGKINSRNDFSALFVNPYYTGPTVQAEHTQTASSLSMAELNSTAQGTRSIMATSAGSNFARIFSKTLSIVSAFWKKAIPLLHSTAKTAKHFIILMREKLQKRNLPQETSGESMTVNRFLEEKKYVFRKLVSNLKAFLNGQTRSQAKEKLLLSLKQAVAYSSEAIKSRLKSLSIVSRVLISLSVLFIFLFVQSILSLQAKQKSEREFSAFQEQVRMIDLKEDLAEASLLYENEEKALAILSEAQLLLSSISQKKQKEKDEYVRLQARLQTIRAKIDHVTLLASIPPLAQLESQIPNLSSLQFVANEDTILLWNSDAVYSFDPEKGTVRQIDTQAKLPSIQCATASATTVYFCTGDGNRVGVLNLKDKSVSTVALPFADNEKHISALVYYNQKLYVLDGVTGTIFKHAKKGDSFEQGVQWIKDSTNIQDAKSFAVDGSFYVAQPSNAVIQLSSGKVTSFALPTIDPAPNDIKIWTSDISPLLYILDRGNKRIILIEKTGKKIKNQFTSPTFTDLRDFVITKKDLFVINGSDILKLPGR